MRPITFTLPYPGKSTFIPAGCLHWPIGEKDLLRQWVKAVARADNGFTILMGDSLDCARTHYRDYIRGYRQDENSQEQLDAWVKQDVAALAKVLEPIKKRIVGSILGNHYWTFCDETNSEQYLCQLLGIPYLGPTGIVRLEFRDSRGSVRGQQILYAHHSGGSQGSRSTSADVASLIRSENSFDADIYCLSHTHRRIAWREPLLTLNAKGQPRITDRTKTFVRAGAFLKGFKQEGKIPVDHPHRPSYAEKKALRPTDLGWVELGMSVKLYHGEGFQEAKRNGKPEPNNSRVEVKITY